jgi:hypothetical protein
VPSDGVRDATSYEVTPGASKGALGTWRALAGPGLRAGITATIKDGPSPACKPSSRGVYVSQHLSFLGVGKAAGGHARVRTTLGKSDRVGSKRGLTETWTMVELGPHLAYRKSECWKLSA